MKKILITGKNSYLGNSLYDYLEGHYAGQYDVKRISMREDEWRSEDLGEYDAIYYVAGVAHVDSSIFGDRAEEVYTSVNAGLAAEFAEKAAEDGAKQFIFLSSMSVYDGYKGGMITPDTPLEAESFYGKSKILAEKSLTEILDKKVKLCILRPPMIYGKNCKGNFVPLIKIAKKVPFFPATNNRRSSLFVDNLNEFVRLVTENGDEGIFSPQNGEYSDTAQVVKCIAKALGKKMPIVGWLGWTVPLACHLPGKLGRMAKKAFGNLYYDMPMSEYGGGNYRVAGLYESVEMSVK